MEHSKKTTREEYQKCVNAVVDYINLHLGEEIDLKSLAKISHFSPFYFHRIMKAFLGEPIGTFIVRTRTESAARLLRYSDLPIADIAYRIGYSSPSSLSKVFKQFYGISPNEYRNNKNFVIMKPAIIRPDLELKKEIREVPARNVIYIRLFGDYKMNDYGGTWMRLFQFIKEEKLPMGDMAPYCMYRPASLGSVSVSDFPPRRGRLCVYSWFAALMISTKSAGFRDAPPIRPPSSSSQSPLCSGQPAGYPSLRSLAPPLRHGPASLGSVSVSDFPARRGRLQFTPGSQR